MLNYRFSFFMFEILALYSKVYPASVSISTTPHNMVLFRYTFPFHSLCHNLFHPFVLRSSPNNQTSFTLFIPYAFFLVNRCTNVTQHWLCWPIQVELDCFVYVLLCSKLNSLIFFSFLYP
jgi:hypothetical protein